MERSRKKLPDKTKNFGLRVVAPLIRNDTVLRIRARIETPIPYHANITRFSAISRESSSSKNKYFKYILSYWNFYVLTIASKVWYPRSSYAPFRIWIPPLIGNALSRDSRALDLSI